MKKVISSKSRRNIWSGRDRKSLLIVVAVFLGTCAASAASTIKYGSGKYSDFELPVEMGGGSAHVTGVSGLSGTDFKLTTYKGNTWEMNGKPPAEPPSYYCFTGSSSLIDVEKDKTFENADDYWCSEFTCLNLAYFGGWIPAKKYATVDAVANAFRSTYKKNPENLYTFEWLDGKLKSFGFSNRGFVEDYLVDFEGDFADLDSVQAFLEEQFENDKRWIFLDAWGHAVTCCGYSVDGEGILNGLFIIDSDNDMFNKGGEKAPNRIMYCPVRVAEDDWGPSVQIANIFAEEWTDIDLLFSLRNVNEKLEPFEFVYDPEDGSRIIGSTGVLPLNDAVIVVPEGVTEIAYRAFEENLRLTKVVLPSTLERIGNFAFSGCERLSSVNLNGHDLEIGAYAFCDCTALKSIVLSDSVRSVGDSCFYNCTALEKVVVNSERTSFNTTALLYETYGSEGYQRKRLPKVKFALGEDGEEILDWVIVPEPETGDVADPFTLLDWSSEYVASPVIGFGWSFAHVLFGEYKTADGKAGTLAVSTAKKSVKNGKTTVTFTVTVKVDGKTYTYKDGMMVDGEITKQPKSSTKKAPALVIDSMSGDDGVRAQVGDVDVSAQHIVAPKFDGYEQTGGNAMVGFGYEGQVAFTSDLGGLKFSASGLPKGLAINASTGVISGVPTKAGTYKVKITATNKAWSSKKATETVEIVIAEMPADARGSFTGVLGEEGDDAPIDGLATLTIGSTGKISAKFVLDGTNWTFSASGYSSAAEQGVILESPYIENAFEGKAKAKVGKKNLTADFSATRVIGGIGITGKLTFSDGSTKDVELFANLGKLPSTSEWLGAYTWLSPDGGCLSLKVKDTGTVTASGKLGNGKKISLSTPLCVEGVVVLHAPAAKQTVNGRKVLLPKFCNAVQLKPYAGVQSEENLDCAYRDAGVRASIDGKGSVKYSTSFGQAAAGKTVTVTATAAKNNVFAYWADAEGNIVSLTSKYSVKMGADDIRLSAVFRPTSAYSATEVPELAVPEGAFESLLVGVKFSTQVTVDEKFYPVKFTASNLPKGLSINQTTGVISGVPTTAGMKDVTISAASTAVKNAAKGSTGALPVTVQKLPKSMLGKFVCDYIEFWDGPLALKESVQAKATTSFSVSETGKCVGTIKIDKKTTYSFTVGSFAGYDGEEGVYRANATLKVGKKSYAVDIRVHEIGEDIFVADLYYSYGGEEAGFASLQRQ